MKKMAKKGPSEMKGQGGKTHKGIKGPGAMKDSAGTAPMKSTHESQHAQSDLHGYLGADKGELMKGHRSLEKVSANDLGGKKEGRGPGAKEGGGDGDEDGY